MNYKYRLDALDHIGSFYNDRDLGQWNSEYNGFFIGHELSQDFIAAMVQLKDEIYSTISKDYWAYITERFLGCSLNASGNYSHEAIVIFTVVNVESNCLGLGQLHSVKQKHGGVRSGAGRKKEQPTKQIRVDFTLANQFKELSELFRSQDFSEQNDLLLALSQVFKSHSSNNVS